MYYSAVLFIKSSNISNGDLIRSDPATASASAGTMLFSDYNRPMLLEGNGWGFLISFTVNSSKKISQDLPQIQALEVIMKRLNYSKFTDDLRWIHQATLGSETSLTLVCELLYQD